MALFNCLKSVGLPVGFANEELILRSASNACEVLVVARAEERSLPELLALERYRNDGGVLLVDDQCFDEEPARDSPTASERLFSYHDMQDLQVQVFEALQHAMVES